MTQVQETYKARDTWGKSLNAPVYEDLDTGAVSHRKTQHCVQIVEVAFGQWEKRKVD